MNERTMVKSVVALLVAVVVWITGNTDLIFIGAALAFFVVTIAYAEWCERL